MANMVSGNFPNAIDIVLNEIILEKWDEVKYPYSEIFSEEETSRKVETDIGYVPLPTFEVVAENGAYTPAEILEGTKKQFTQVKYGIKVPMSQELFMFNQYPEILNVARSLARAMKYTVALQCANVFNNAFGSETTRDGSSIFNTAHTLDGGGTASNRPGTDADLAYTAFWAGITNFLGQVDDANLKINVVPELLYVTPSDLQTALEITSSAFKPGGSTNESNVAKDRFNIRVEFDPLLTDADAWFLLGKKGQTGFKIVWSLKDLSQTWGDNNYDQIIHKRAFIAAFGCNDWRASYGTTGAS
jgi:hypothetical protein